MPEGPAADSFKYALNPELLKLYGAVFVGYVVLKETMFWSKFVVDVEPFQTLLELPFLLCGTALVVGGLVGSLHRILSDTASSGQR
ncbi:hypothetical protein [Halopelagius longus]|uniref:Uncharacterized protein n=1 Tax=Halopelagius longus TaxID=1236180 RepID=A0A1H1D3P6_9EURY|nr:hypothetical protein [Halopelagius longus]RDI71154.1 hypothetical protein DWB78_05090 [Halopelagius longus]SDQ71093.1 hypothetical protein SAMN05216278_2213 [Halopelagius longus]